MSFMRISVKTSFLNPFLDQRYPLRTEFRKTKEYDFKVRNFEQDPEVSRRSVDNFLRYLKTYTQNTMSMSLKITIKLKESLCKRMVQYIKQYN